MIHEPKPLTRKRLIRHAELYGTADIYDTAVAGGLGAEELGWLAKRLRNIDKSWKLTREQTDELALRLIRAKMPDRDILSTCSISRPTLSKAHSKAADRESFGDSDG